MELSEEENKWYNYNAEDEIVNEGSSGEQEKSLIGELLKQLKPGTEIYSLSMPAYLMSLKTSKLNLLGPVSLLDGINLCKDPAERCLKVALWVFSSWRSVPSKTLEQSKPVNSIQFSTSSIIRFWEKFLNANGNMNLIKVSLNLFLNKFLTHLQFHVSIHSIQRENSLTMDTLNQHLDFIGTLFTLKLKEISTLNFGDLKRNTKLPTQRFIALECSWEAEILKFGTILMLFVKALDFPAM
jgi:hypothetical protein